MKYLFAVLLLIVLLGAQIVSAQDAPPLSAALKQQMLALEQTTSTIRGLDELKPLEHDFPTRDDVTAYLRDTIDTMLPEADADRYLQFYVALDLLEPDVDLRRLYLDLLGSQIAGYYDTDTKVMNVVALGGEIDPDGLSLVEKIIYVHEYTHALQDQHFDLDALLDESVLMSNPDTALAISALVEGDATAVMNVYTEQIVTENPLAAFQILGESMQMGGLTLPPGIPPILGRELLFPYEGGLSFVMTLHRQGGWEAVNAAFNHPPQSSEHILHPQTYLERDIPQTVTLGDGTLALGAGWEKTWDTTLGEWYLREHLSTQLARTNAQRAAAGWGGDALHIYRNGQTDQLALVLRLAWDTSADAAEFNAAYVEFADARFDSAARNDCWSNADEALCLTTDDGDTLIAYAPTVQQAAELIDAQT